MLPRGSGPNALAVGEITRGFRAHDGHLCRRRRYFQGRLCHRASGGRLLYFWLNRQPRGLPGIPTADQGACVGPTSLSELLRHTGAGGFLRSSTIGH